MHALESYLRRLHEIRATERGTPELSYRAALENLLNVAGSGLDPAVQATAELADTGAGRPDFGLFDARSGDLRSAVEVKPVAEDTPQTADGRQARYWKHYGCVLVTNCRDFLLVLKGMRGAAFFRSSLVQTLFYGLFSGWMLWRQNRRNGDRFDSVRQCL